MNYSYTTTPMAIERLLQQVEMRIKEVEADKDINIVSHTGAATVTLPTSPTEGTRYSLINKGVGVVTVNRGGTNTIDNGALTTVDLNQYDRFTLLYAADGNWYII